MHAGQIDNCFLSYFLKEEICAGFIPELRIHVRLTTGAQRTKISHMRRTDTAVSINKCVGFGWRVIS